MNKEQMRIAITKLREWAGGEVPGLTASGICSNLEYAVGTSVYTVLKPMFYAWPEYSGDPDYPIRHPDWDSPQYGYDITYGMWEGEYGRRRRVLCAHLAGCFQDMLERA